MAIPKIAPHRLEAIARILADCATHRQLTDLFSQVAIDAPLDGSKWSRIHIALKARQERDRNANNVGGFIQLLMDPSLHLDDRDLFEKIREGLNQLLAFEKLAVGEDGELSTTKEARTIPEAQQRANRLRAELERRRVHSEVIRFCRAELLDENYFHATLEATKSVAERIREKSGMTGDGGPLVTGAFLGQTPALAINTLTTDTERSEQKGFANLLIGVFGHFRNPTAHAPRIQWLVTEEDALDLFSLLSYIHRRLDGAVRIPSS